MKDQDDSLHQGKVFCEENVEQRHAEGDCHCDQGPMPSLVVVCIRVTQHNQALNHCTCDESTDCGPDLVSEDTKPPDEIGQYLLDIWRCELGHPVVLTACFEQIRQCLLPEKFLDANIPEVGAIEAISAMDREMRMKPIHVAI